MQIKYNNNALIEYTKLVTKGWNRLKSNDLDPNEYYEWHHVLPECWFKNRSRKGKPGWLEGDPNESANYIPLEGREHFLAHYWLMKAFPSLDSTKHAAFMVGKWKKNDLLSIFELAEKWHEVKRAHAEAVSRRCKGKKLTPEHIEATKKANRPRPVFCIETGEVFYSCKVAAQTVGLKCLADVWHTCNGNRRTAAGLHFAFVDEDNINYTFAPTKCPYCNSEDTIKSLYMNKFHFDNCIRNPDNPNYIPKVKHTYKREKVTCPHCNVTGDPGAMSQRHFDNCKMNPNYKQPPKVTCPHCLKELDSKDPNTKKLHFDRCKLHPNYVEQKLECPHCNKQVLVKGHHFDNCKMNPNRILPVKIFCPHCNKTGFNNDSNFKSSHFNKCKMNPNYDSNLHKRTSKTKICPHCNTSGAANNMTRWHFNNCKQKPNQQSS